MSLDGVATTAVSTARIRAGESRRRDRLFDDPLAAEVVRAAGVHDRPDGLSNHPVREYLRLQVVVRTGFYDAFVRSAVTAGCRQVVLVGAGYDARAIRMKLPSQVSVFELDQPSVLDAKAAAIQRLGLRATAQRIPVPVDVRTDGWTSALAAAGHDRSAPTAWLLEGLLVYLDSDTAARLLDGITALSPAGSRLACEQTLPARSRAQRHEVALVVPAARWWIGGTDQPVDSWLGGRGWKCREVSVSDAAAQCGRPVPDALREIADRGGFVTASRQE